MWADYTEGPRATILRVFTTDLEFPLSEGNTKPKPWDEIKRLVRSCVAVTFDLQMRAQGYGDYAHEAVDEYIAAILNEDGAFDGEPMRVMYTQWRDDFLKQPTEENASEGLPAGYSQWDERVIRYQYRRNGLVHLAKVHDYMFTGDDTCRVTPPYVTLCGKPIRIGAGGWGFGPRLCDACARINDPEEN